MLIRPFLSLSVLVKARKDNCPRNLHVGLLLFFRNFTYHLQTKKESNLIWIFPRSNKAGLIETWSWSNKRFFFCYFCPPLLPYVVIGHSFLDILVRTLLTCLSLAWTAHLKLSVRFPDRVLTNSWKVIADVPIWRCAISRSLRMMSFPGEMLVMNSRLSKACSKSSKGISPKPSESNKSKRLRHSSLMGGKAKSWSGSSSSA